MAEQRLDKFSAQNLANMAWAFATADRSDALLFALLVRAVERRLGEFNPQNLANTVWAFVMADRSDALLLAPLVRAMEWRLGKFKPQGLANTAWALEAQTAGRRSLPIRTYSNVFDHKKFELRTSVRPSNLAPIGTKLRENAFRTICNFRFFDVEKFFSNFFSKKFRVFRDFRLIFA